ncbi:hypothetical protein BaRGS_00031869, partial [Batillaria attramentaria]
LNNGETWNSGQTGPPAPPGAVRMFEGQYNGTSGETIDHFLGPTPPDGMPSLMNKSPADMYNRSSGFSSPAPQGMMGNAMPMSPDALSAGKTTCAPYYSYSKRTMEDSVRGGRPNDKFPTESSKRSRKGGSDRWWCNVLCSPLPSATCAILHVYSQLGFPVDGGRLGDTVPDQFHV